MFDKIRFSAFLRGAPAPRTPEAGVPMLGETPAFRPKVACGYVTGPGTSTPRRHLQFQRRRPYVLLRRKSSAYCGSCVGCAIFANYVASIEVPRYSNSCFRRRISRLSSRPSQIRDEPDTSGPFESPVPLRSRSNIGWCAVRCRGSQRHQLWLRTHPRRLRTERGAVWAQPSGAEPPQAVSAPARVRAAARRGPSLAQLASRSRRAAARTVARAAQMVKKNTVPGVQQRNDSVALNGRLASKVS
jgi:hypothetical protein